MQTMSSLTYARRTELVFVIVEHFHHLPLSVLLDQYQLSMLLLLLYLSQDALVNANPRTEFNLSNHDCITNHTLQIIKSLWQRELA